MIQLYNPVTRIVYTTGDYKLDTGHHTITHLDLTYNVGMLLGTYSSYLDPDPEPYHPVTQVHYLPPHSEPVQVTVYYIPPPTQPQLFQRNILPNQLKSSTLIWYASC